MFREYIHTSNDPGLGATKLAMKKLDVEEHADVEAALEGAGLVPASEEA
jgi:hypothetical protein